MINRFHVGQRMSQIVEYPAAANVIVLAGQVADERKGGIREQTADILAKIDRLLAEAGADREHLTEAQIWLAHAADFDAMNEVWDEWVPSGHAPVRACVESRLADPDLRVEIQVRAIKP